MTTLTSPATPRPVLRGLVGHGLIDNDHDAIPA